MQVCIFIYSFLVFIENVRGEYQVIRIALATGWRGGEREKKLGVGWGITRLFGGWGRGVKLWKLPPFVV